MAKNDPFTIQTVRLCRFGSQKEGLKIAFVIPKALTDMIYKKFKDKDVSLIIEEFK